MEKTKTNYEILGRVIKKAIDNGWKQEVISKIYGDTESITSVDFAVKDTKKHMDLLIGNFILYSRQMLLDHEFAKAYWGKDKVCPKCGAGFRVIDEGDGEAWVCDDDEYHGDWNDGSDNPPAWQYHLQQMVLCEEPLDYLKKFL